MPAICHRPVTWCTPCADRCTPSRSTRREPKRKELPCRSSKGSGAVPAPAPEWRNTAFPARARSCTFQDQPAAPAAASELALSDRKGELERLKLAAAGFETPRVSPDGQRVAFGLGDTIWTYNLAGTAGMQRLTFGGKNRFPIWSADGRHVAFQSDREGDLAVFWQLADGSGTAERLTKPEQGEAHVPLSWAPKGEDRFLFDVIKSGDVSLATYSLRDRKVAPFGQVRSTNPTGAVFSPDARWVAYTQTEQGRLTVVVQPDPPTGARYQLFAKGGDGPHEVTWSSDGKEIFYNPRPGGFEAVSVTTQPAFAFGNPVAVPRAFILGPPSAQRAYDVVSSSGKFLALVAPASRIPRATRRRSPWSSTGSKNCGRV